MSEEKVLTLRGKKAVWAPGGGSGPIDPSRLPEGYPYKEGVTIEWDGNTDGLLSVNGSHYKVSDTAPDNETLKNNTVITICVDGEYTDTPISNGWDDIVDSGFVKDEYVILGTFCVITRADNLVVNGMVFPEAGVYFYKYDTNYVSKLSTETVHTMSEEFMPLLTSPNGTKYKLTVSDDGTLSAVAQS